MVPQLKFIRSWICELLWEASITQNEPGFSNICKQIFKLKYRSNLGFPGGSVGRETACSVEDLGSIPGSRGPLEKGMATLSSIPAWRIPWTEEPDGLQFMGLASLPRTPPGRRFLSLPPGEHILAEGLWPTGCLSMGA